MPSRYLVVELLTAATFTYIYTLFPANLLFVALYSILAAFLILIVIYDIRHTIIPDELTLGVVVLVAVFLGYEFFETHNVILTVWRFAAGFFGALFFWGLWYVSKGRWIGLGDAKLAFPLGVLVGIEGVFSMVVLSFWIGALISLTLLGVERLSKRGKTRLHFSGTPLTIRSEVPFAPFLVAGFVCVHFFHADIFTIIYSLIYFG